MTNSKIKHVLTYRENTSKNKEWIFVRSGDADMDIALKMVEYLGAEMDYVPWYAARHELSYVQKMLTRSNLYGKFKVLSTCTYHLICVNFVESWTYILPTWYLTLLDFVELRSFLYMGENLIYSTCSCVCLA